MKSSSLQTALAFLVLTATVSITNRAEATRQGEFALPAEDLRPGEVVQGDLVSVKVIPGAKKTMFFIVGKKAAEVNMKNVQLNIILPNDRPPLPLKREKNGFVYEEHLAPGSDLEVKTGEGKSERLHLKKNP